LDAARQIAASTGGEAEGCTDPAAACQGPDVIATDVWASMGQEAMQAEPRAGDQRRRHRRPEQRGLGAGGEPAARAEGADRLAPGATVTPLTKTARQARIAAILSREQVRSQEELADLLERYASVHVTQATLSRDLDELGVVRLRATGGGLVDPPPREPRRTP